MRVVVAGAGIGGLTLALALHDAGIEVEVHEAVQQIKPLGVGINLLPHASAVLARLDALDAIARLGVPTSELRYYNRHGQLVLAEPRGLDAGYPVPQLSIHRGRLQLGLLDLVRERLGEGSVVTSSRVIDVEQSGDGIEVLIEDRRTATRSHVDADLMVAADGIHSTARARFAPDEGPPRWSGELMWRATSRFPSFLSGSSMIMIGTRSRKLVAYPLTEPDADGLALINWIAVLDRSATAEPGIDDWNRPGRLDDIAPEFAEWRFDWLDVPTLLASAEQTFVFPMVDRDPLPRWTEGRVTLLGDAAHPMYPVGSNGASQAILDAAALAESLRATSSLQDAVDRYEERRRPATARVVEANRGQGAAQVLDIAEQRAPNGFSTIEEVFGPGELEGIVGRYRQVAGFDAEQVRALLRPSSPVSP